ncbi:MULTISPECIES: phage head-tail joining protein [unclassified Bradyrhizobium]|uniref:phage head-tail joining protein n=1 Tax=unclassified Bradyrhizobium TaxID=2631580 RepID=UPI002915FA90|nr:MULTISPECIES: hypothetical protein [unclassified Bradyrhizobium]
MAWTQVDIDTLKAAIATGARRVRYGSGPDAHEVEYQSTDHMFATLDRMLAEVSPATAARRVSYIAHERF